jgi:hypothetical protein
MKYLNYLVLLTVLSCGLTEVKRNIDEPQSYQSSGTEQFFLAELPDWANFSSSGDCFRSRSFAYLDFKKVAASYQLTYPEMIELQAQYNARVEKYYRSTAVKFLKPVEQASFFSNTLEQVRGGIRSFKLPRVDAVDIIWIDSFIKENKIAEIKSMIHKGHFNQRLPVLFSACLSRESLDQWVVTNNFEAAGFYLMGAEFLSPFNSEIAAIPGLRIEISKFIDPSIKTNIIISNPAMKMTELVIK